MESHGWTRGLELIIIYQYSFLLLYHNVNILFINRITSTTIVKHSNLVYCVSNSLERLILSEKSCNHFTQIIFHIKFPNSSFIGLNNYEIDPKNYKKL